MTKSPVIAGLVDNDIRLPVAMPPRSQATRLLAPLGLAGLDLAWLPDDANHAKPANAQDLAGT